MVVPEEQRVWIHITAEGESLSILWGDTEHDSKLSFDGTAQFIPEFPSFLTLSLFMIATLLIVTVYRAKVSPTKS